MVVGSLGYISVFNGNLVGLEWLNRYAETNGCVGFRLYQW